MGASNADPKSGMDPWAASDPWSSAAQQTNRADAEDNPGKGSTGLPYCTLNPAGGQIKWRKVTLRESLDVGAGMDAGPSDVIAILTAVLTQEEKRLLRESL